jgi:hypothetical protein
MKRRSGVLRWRSAAELPRDLNAGEIDLGVLRSGALHPAAYRLPMYYFRRTALPVWITRPFKVTA